MRKYLKDARTKLGLSQNDVAKKLGISPNYYSCIESGDRQSDMKVSFLIDLSGILEIPIGKMLSFEKSIERKRKKASDSAKETEEVTNYGKNIKDNSNNQRTERTCYDRACKTRGGSQGTDF